MFHIYDIESLTDDVRNQVQDLKDKIKHNRALLDNAAKRLHDKTGEMVEKGVTYARINEIVSGAQYVANTRVRIDDLNNMLHSVLWIHKRLSE